MLEFLNQYVSHPNQPLKIFGLTPNPDTFEGAGCGSFVASMLKASRAFPDDVIKNLYRKLDIPHRLIGTNIDLKILDGLVVPFKLSDKPEKHEISALSFINSDWNTDSREQYVPLNFVDPEMFIFSLRIGFLFAKNNNLVESKIESYIKNRYIYSYENNSDKMETKTSYIDESYDSQAKIINESMSKWLLGKKEAKYKFQLSTLLGSQTLIIQK
jgi:hypothetical protein